MSTSPELQTAHSARGSSRNESPLGVGGEADSVKRRVGASVWLMLVYVWYFVTTPDVRFRVLADIHFERVLVALIVLALLAGAKIPRRFGATTWLFVVFFLWLTVSHAFSPYKNVPTAEWWAENYWKLLVFYFFLIYSIRSIHGLFVFAAGVCVISFFYQFHSWTDYVNGGSYVYQQGMKRIVGVWSGGGIGAANGFGLLGLFSLPFGIFWLKLTKRPRIRVGLVLYLATCFATVVFSGTRAAVLGAAVLLLLTFGRSILKLKVILSVVLIVAMVIPMLPEDLRHRYFDLIVTSSDDRGAAESAEEQAADEIAKESAHNRVQGLIDGWNLFLKRPMIGYGPGTSGTARHEVNPSMGGEGDADVLELHNLYGQVLSETGIVGTVLFLWLLLAALAQIRSIRRRSLASSSRASITAACDLLQTSLLMMVFYGMFGHTLYRYYWVVLFAMQVALLQVVAEAERRAAVGAATELDAVPRAL